MLTKINLAGITVLIRTDFDEASKCFTEFGGSNSEINEEVCFSSDASYQYIDEEEWSYLESVGIKRNGQNEASALTAFCSDQLLMTNRCIIHGGAFSFAGKAWVIVAPSGTGKSTQIRCLQIIAPGCFSVICGDRPVVEIIDNSTAIVHPSPWNGKENWHGAPPAQLAGIICLQRGDHNSFDVMSKREAVLPVFSSLIQTAKTNEIIRKAAAFEDNLLNSCEIYRLVSNSVPDSTKLMYEYLFSKQI